MYINNLFMSSLERIALFAEPNMVITKRKVTCTEEEGKGVDIQYTLSGHDEKSGVTICVRSEGYVNRDGQQIEVIVDGKKRLFPFFGFNWKYLETPSNSGGKNESGMTEDDEVLA